MRVVVHVDGGSRGNPGPAASAAVVSAPGGELLAEETALIGHATNNVAEYRAVLLGISEAVRLGASELEIVNDSELVARQLNGEYRVKHADMRPLYERALAALSRFESWSIRSVPRSENARADALVNAALDRAGARQPG